MGNGYGYDFPIQGGELPQIPPEVQRQAFFNALLNAGAGLLAAPRLNTGQAIGGFLQGLQGGYGGQLSGYRKDILDYLREKTGIDLAKAHTGYYNAQADYLTNTRALEQQSRDEERQAKIQEKKNEAIGRENLGIYPTLTDQFTNPQELQTAQNAVLGAGLQYAPKPVTDYLEYLRKQQEGLGKAEKNRITHNITTNEKGQPVYAYEDGTPSTTPAYIKPDKPPQTKKDRMSAPFIDQDGKTKVYNYDTNELIEVSKGSIQKPGTQKPESELRKRLFGGKNPTWNPSTGQFE